MEWKKGEVRYFLELLLEKTDFEVLLLDLGCVMSGFFEVLDLCQKIWILKENRTSKDPGIEELKEIEEAFGAKTLTDITGLNMSTIYSANKNSLAEKTSAGDLQKGLQDSDISGLYYLSTLP